MSTSLLTINTLELMKLWGELVEAYHCKNGYNGDTAEIYAYRLMPYSPTAHGGEFGFTGAQARREVNRSAAMALCELCELFAAQYGCAVGIQGGGDEPKWLEPRDWLKVEAVEYFDHRAHVRVWKI